MSTVYDEGPYKNWRAIHFPSGVVQVHSATYGPASFDVVRFWLGADSDADASKFQGLITGKTSGATVDLSLVPVAARVYWTLSGIPTCVYSSFGNFYTLAGAPVASAPFVGAMLYNNGTGGQRAEVWQRHSYAYDIGPPEVCAAQLDAGAITSGTFIIGEECTVVYPE